MPWLRRRRHPPAKSWVATVRGAGPPRPVKDPDHELEQADSFVEARLLALQLDNAATVRDRRAVPAEELADFGQREPASDVGDVHSDLTGERHVGATASGHP